MIEKIKKQLHNFKDIRVIGFAAFAGLVLLVSWSTVTVIQTNYDLQKQVSQLEQQNEVNRLENNNLKLKNQFYNTDQYLELTARRQFGKAAPGEKVLLVPKDVALAHTVDLPEPKNSHTTDSDKPFYRRNWESWLDYLFHRQPTGAQT